MKRNSALLALIFLLCALSSVAGCGSDSGSGAARIWGTGGATLSGGGTIKGVVVNSDSLVPLDGIAISAGNQATVTDKDGNYVISGIPAGTVTVTARSQDYDTTVESVQVADGQEVTRNLSMDCNYEDWLDYGTAYRWQVEAVHPDGTTEQGPVWGFTTENRGTRVLPRAVFIGRIDEKSARTVAQAFLDSSKAAGFSISSSEAISDKEGAALAYAFMLAPAGYVVVPADRADAAPPVLAYSFDSPYSSAPGTPNLLASIVRLDVKMRLGAHPKGLNISASEGLKNRALWNQYLAGKAYDTGKERAVYGPLLKAAWHQFTPYNDRCPMDPKAEDDGSSSRCLVGCVATAFSEVFNYHRVPEWYTFTGVDNYVTKTRGISINAADATCKDLKYNNGEPDSDTKAKISFANGVLVKMNYSKDGSYAGIFTFGKNITYCGYQASKDKRYEINDPASFDRDTLIAEIKASRPCVMLIRKVKEDEWAGGHCVVIDGYNESDKTFHVSFGWRDTSWNTWYSLPTDAPSGYNFVRGYVYNIIPSGKDAAPPGPRAVAPESPFPDDNDANVAVDEELEWEDCDNTSYYNCYVWKAGEQKPSVPTFANLRGAAADANFLTQ
ncbi:MAG: C10 family peptidase [Candidatus Eremiobacteraeota bacterium]|nr:C10 family peptidase [Candidatus Eremiobacteraeota bacterium]